MSLRILFQYFSLSSGSFFMRCWYEYGLTHLIWWPGCWSLVSQWVSGVGWKLAGEVLMVLEAFPLQSPFCWNISSRSACRSGRGPEQSQSWLLPRWRSRFGRVPWTACLRRTLHWTSSGVLKWLCGCPQCWPSQKVLPALWSNPWSSSGSRSFRIHLLRSRGQLSGCSIPVPLWLCLLSWTGVSGLCSWPGNPGLWWFQCSLLIRKSILKPPQPWICMCSGLLQHWPSRVILGKTFSNFSPSLSFPCKRRCLPGEGKSADQCWR